MLSVLTFAEYHKSSVMYLLSLIVIYVFYGFPLLLLVRHPFLGVNSQRSVHTGFSGLRLRSGLVPRLSVLRLTATHGSRIVKLLRPCDTIYGDG